MNLIALKKGLIVLSDLQRNNQELAYNLQSVLMSNGYALTRKAFEIACKADEAVMLDYIEVFKKYIQINVGNVKAKAIPQLVAEGELGNGVYTSFSTWLDIFWDSGKQKNLQEYFEFTKFKEIDVCDEDQFKRIFTSLVQINTALTPSDFKIIEWFAKKYGNDNIMPDVIPFKENLCMLASLGLDLPVKTTTDVLRIAFYLSTGKSDLILEPAKVRVSAWSRMMIDNPHKSKTYFKSFDRPTRRYILSLLNKLNYYQVEEMVLRKGMWLRLGERLHPGEYKIRFANAYAMFDAIRNKEIKSWYGKVDAKFKESFEQGLDFLAKRPGEFARRLDALLRNNTAYQSSILNKFQEIGANISSKVLWELYTHFTNRNEFRQRSIWIKGARKPTPLPTLPRMKDSDIDRILDCILGIFFNKFCKMEPLGKVYIDEELKKIPIPTNMRTLSESTMVTIRGTRMPLDTNHDIIRTYVHWKSGVDLDLSMSIFNNKRESIVCSYVDTRPRTWLHHSGDVIPNTLGNWAEYIDIDISAAVANGYQYGILTLRNFSGGTLADKGAIVGFSERKTVSGGNKSWTPSSVTSSYIPCSKGSNLILLAIDFSTREWILIDEDQSGIPVEFRHDMFEYVKSLVQEPKLSVYDILKLHTEARGQLVTEVENAEKLFMFKDFSTSYETIAEYML